MPTSVIQGCFPHGVRTTPNWVRNCIQPKAAPGARPMPPLQVPEKGAVQLAPSQARFPAGAGQPLAPAVRQQMEAVFNCSFDDVRVHVGPHVSTLGAVAFTQGTNIHFAHGQYDPATPHGRQILAHELTHVVQQKRGRVQNPFGSGVAVVHDAALEAEASRMALRAAVAPVVQRASDWTEVKPKETSTERMTRKVEKIMAEGASTSVYVWWPELKGKPPEVPSGYMEQTENKLPSTLLVHVKKLTTKNPDGTDRSGLSCAEPNAVAYGLRSGATLAKIRISMAYDHNTSKMKPPCANCSTWLEKAEYAIGYQWYSIKADYLN